MSIFDMTDAFYYSDYSDANLKLICMMNTSLHISLPEKLKDAVKRKVEEGHYSNPTDYVRQLIRQDILRDEAKKEFLSFIAEGMNSPSSGQSPKEMIDEIREEIQSKA